MVRVVLVDNDEAVLTLLRFDLGLEGHDIVATASSGEAAITTCAEHNPDVLVVDLRLGAGIDGLEVARRVASTVPRIVLHTNYVTPAVVDAAEQAGAVVIEKGNLSALRRAVAA